MSFATNSVTQGQCIRGGMSSAVIYLVHAQIAVLAHRAELPFWERQTPEQTLGWREGLRKAQPLLTRLLWDGEFSTRG